MKQTLTKVLTRRIPVQASTDFKFHFRTSHFHAAAAAGFRVGSEHHCSSIRYCARFEWIPRTGCQREGLESADRSHPYRSHRFRRELRLQLAARTV